MCSGCGNRHDPDRCPHTQYAEYPSDWVRRAMYERQAERDYEEEE